MEVVINGLRTRRGSVRPRNVVTPSGTLGPASSHESRLDGFAADCVRFRCPLAMRRGEDAAVGIEVRNRFWCCGF